MSKLSLTMANELDFRALNEHYLTTGECFKCKNGMIVGSEFELNEKTA